MLVCGYRRTGKDTLVKMFNEELPFNWIIYRNSDSEKYLDVKPVKRVGFADKLRQEVNQILNLTDNFDYETFKETIVRKFTSGEFTGDDGKTYRDFLIEHGGFRRSQDVNYWVKQVLPMVTEESMITDWRFVNELLYLQSNLDLIKTIRLFRSEVPIPSMNIDSEHNLDNTTTDFLLVTNEEEFVKACEVFPQYKNFVRQ